MASARRDTALPQICRLLERGDTRGPARRPAPGTVHRRPRRAGLRGAGPAARSDGHGRLPPRARGPQRRRRCLPGRLPPAARKARSIWADGSVGGWLHRVAWRIALQVKSDAARRRDQERLAAERAGEAIAAGPWHDDTAAVIHQEIDRLPERYRRPVVLCYLEDMTYQQAAEPTAVERGDDAGPAGAGAGAAARPADPSRGDAGGDGPARATGHSPSTASAVPAALLRCAVRAARHIGLGESAAAASRRRRSS